jgi:hypothetical protein
MLLKINGAKTEVFHIPTMCMKVNSLYADTHDVDENAGA